MNSCFESKCSEITNMRDNHSKILWAVLLINACMFIIEGVSGLLAHSTSLMADALDMFGDSLVYAFSLMVVTRSIKWQAVVSMMKGIFMMAFGLGVLIEAIYKMFLPIMPETGIMGVIGVFALMANLLCLLLLYQHRDDNLNMSSTWLCSRNDLIPNVGVLIAAALVYLLHSHWPDIIVGCCIVAIFLKSAFGILSQPIAALKH